jgi:hypothetical protein
MLARDTDPVRVVTARAAVTSPTAPSVYTAADPTTAPGYAAPTVPSDRTGGALPPPVVSGTAAAPAPGVRPLPAAPGTAPAPLATPRPAGAPQEPTGRAAVAAAGAGGGAERGAVAIGPGEGGGALLSTTTGGLMADVGGTSAPKESSGIATLGIVVALAAWLLPR